MKENINKFAKYVGWLFLLVLLIVLITDFLRRGIYNDVTGINLLVVGDENMGLLVMRPNENLVTWVSLPTNIKVKIYNSTAAYPINSLWKFGETEKRPYEITEKSIGTSMGIIIPRMIKVDRVASVDNILGKFLSFGLKTDLSIRDRFLIRQRVSEAAVSKKVIELEIPKIAFDEVLEADGKEFLSMNQVIDVWSKDKFYHEDLLSEGAEVSINNVSDVSGAGSLLSRQLDSSGVRVVEVVNNKNDSVMASGCHFIASKKFVNTIDYLIDQVGCFPLNNKEGKETGDNLIKIWIK